MNSRSYRFLFELSEPSDIPADFLISGDDSSFDKGIFLPQDDKRWFTERPAYPARLLLLREHFLLIIAHPSADEPTVTVNLDELDQIETGQSLLRGWLVLKTSAASYHLPYNTRLSRSLDHFIAAIRRRWLKRFTAIAQPQSNDLRTFGPPPDIKFTNMLRAELDPNERANSIFVAESIEHEQRYVFFRRVTSRPGHMLALTSGSRLLWLTDEEHGRRQRYAGISVSVPASLMQSAKLERSGNENVLVVHFLHNSRWRISLGQSDADAAGFLDDLKGRCLLRSYRMQNQCESIRPQSIGD